MWIKAMTFVLIGVSTVLFAEVPISSRCPETKVINHTPRWTENDQNALNRAKKRCFKIYREAPCLKRFDKIGPLRYNALCGT